MKQLSVRLRLAVLVVFMLLGSPVIGFSGLADMRSAVDGLRTVYLDRVVPLRDLKEIIDAYAVDIVDAAHKARNGNVDQATAARTIRDAQQRIETLWRGYLQTELIEAERTEIIAIEAGMKAAEAPIARLVTLLERGDEAGLVSFIRGELYPLIDPLSEAFSRLIEVQLDESRRQYTVASDIYDRDVVIEMAVMGGFLLGGLVLAWWISSGLLGELGAEPRDLSRRASRIAAGDLSVPAATASRGVARDLESMRAALHEMISRIALGSEELEAAALQLSTSAEQVLAGANQQSGIAASMAAAMEELSSSIAHIADSAADSERTAQSAAGSGQRGLATMNQSVVQIRQIAELVEASARDMDELAAKSGSISTIVNVIRGIAEQTNLLALNAAIEAARAGEQGRGFAVVADEVRGLAARTAQSTAEIVAIVDVIQNGVAHTKEGMASGCDRVRQGLELVQTAGGTMQEVHQALGQTLEASASIARALSEQRQAGDEVAANVEKVAQIVEENTAAQAGITESTRALQALGATLQQMTRRFTL